MAVGHRCQDVLGEECGACRFCRGGRENLCPDARYAFAVPAAHGDVEAALLLCAGLIGYRSYRMAGDARRLGLYGFGAEAHIIVQVAVHEGRDVFDFTSPGDRAKQAFARARDARWAAALVP